MKSMTANSYYIIIFTFPYNLQLLSSRPTEYKWVELDFAALSAVNINSNRRIVSNNYLILRRHYH